MRTFEKENLLIPPKFEKIVMFVQLKVLKLGQLVKILFAKYGRCDG